MTEHACDSTSDAYRLLKLLRLLVGIAAGLVTVATALGWL